MKNPKLLIFLPVILFSSLLFSACGSSQTQSGEDVTFSNEEEIAQEVTTYTDKFANVPIEISQSYNLNQEFKVVYRTEPAGQGNAQFKATSFKSVDSVDDRQPQEGKKLVLVTISVKGDRTNKGSPSTFNQIGDFPSPQFVLIDKENKQNFVEETYYSDAYTIKNNLFELSKITLDHDQWVNTALVFQIDQDITPDLALRFINPEGKVEFYDINESAK